MMVTAITPVDKRKSKVFLEEGFAFVLYRGELEQFGIREGEELEEGTYRQILTEILMGRAKERALYLLSASAKTEGWMRRKLTQGGYPAEAVDYALNFLKEYRYIDDRVYTESFIRSGCGRKSRRQIMYDLQQKGVSKELIAEVLEEFPVDEEKGVRALVVKRMKGKKGLSREEKSHLAGYLGRKGYSFDVINRVITDFEASGAQEWQD